MPITQDEIYDFDPAIAERVVHTYMETEEGIVGTVNVFKLRDSEDGPMILRLRRFTDYGTAREVEIVLDENLSIAQTRAYFT